MTRQKLIQIHTICICNIQNERFEKMILCLQKLKSENVLVEIRFDIQEKDPYIFMRCVNVIFDQKL